MKVDVERILYLKNELKKINDLALEDIEFYEDGKKVEISKEVIDDFSFVGLSNIYFITTGYYKEQSEEVCGCKGPCMCWSR